MIPDVRTAHANLGRWIEAQDYKGWDPFDGLSSRLFRSLPGIRGNRFFRLLWLQAFKRSPLNLRRLVSVPKQANPKAHALLIRAYCRQDINTMKGKLLRLLDEIRDMVQPGYHGACWGYPFDWQARAFYQPAGTPTVVATSYVGSSLLDAYQVLKDASLLDLARSACDFVLKDLNRSFDDEGDFAFSYSPLDSTQVFNATLLGARLLSGVYALTREPCLIEAAEKAVSFVCRRQRPDGAWPYSPLEFHGWVDSFHTGFNLECISEYQKNSGDDRFSSVLDAGFRYYIGHFFTADGLPKYFDTEAYPVDMHSPAQLVVTLDSLRRLDEQAALVERVMSWSLKNMYDPRRGYFYFQKHRWGTNPIPYFRWTQAWMYYALTLLLNKGR